MGEQSSDSKIDAASQDLRAGRLDQARLTLEEFLAAHPGHARAHHLLGVTLAQLGQPSRAIELMRKSVALDPSVADYHGFLGNALLSQNDFTSAAESYRRASELDPNNPQGHNCLAFSLSRAGRLNEAEAAYRRLLELRPNDLSALNDLATTLSAQGKTDESIGYFQRAIDLNPAFVPAIAGIAAALQLLGRNEEACAICRRAVDAHADADADARTGAKNPTLIFQLGNALAAAGHNDEAIPILRQSIQLNPDLIEAHNRLGNTLRIMGDVDEAIVELTEAIRLSPNEAIYHNNLGNAYKDLADMDRANESYSKAVALAPDNPVIHSNQLYSLYFHPACNAESIFRELRKWNDRHAAPLANQIRPHKKSAAANRPLRIGYISPDFRWHPVGRFLIPLVENHAPKRFEVYCYSDGQFPTDLTKRFQRSARVFRTIVGQSDAAVAQIIRDDEIDILVDLTMHMGNNRLLVFARSPAPVQITYLAYPGSTGLDAMNYRITDIHLDPPDEPTPWFSEKSLHLPETYWCYEAPDCDEVSPPPMDTSGHITFGCFNNFSKVSPATLETWAKLLATVPDSRLLLHAPQGQIRLHIRQMMSKSGVDPDRVEFVGRTSFPQFIANHHRVDIALDPFPYGGGTTTCDAMWMGVPTITLRGNQPISRGGVSILTNVGLTDLIANTQQNYIEIAATLAADRSKLRQLRTTLRERMRQSPLMNAAGFARAMEELYEIAWREMQSRM